jgi:hypothetical protein
MTDSTSSLAPCCRGVAKKSREPEEANLVSPATLRKRAVALGILGEVYATTKRDPNASGAFGSRLVVAYTSPRIPSATARFRNVAGETRFAKYLDCSSFFLPLFSLLFFATPLQQGAKLEVESVSSEPERAQRPLRSVRIPLGRRVHFSENPERDGAFLRKRAVALGILGEVYATTKRDPNAPEGPLGAFGFPQGDSTSSGGSMKRDQDRRVL